jgi:hypothetical protein
MFVRDGFAVYGVDRVNSGRSGSDVCAINAARLGVIPAAQMPTINRYSAEAAWVEFRWGPKYGTWYEDTQFPKEALETYLSQLIPNFLTRIQDQLVFAECVSRWSGRSRSSREPDGTDGVAGSARVAPSPGLG